MKLHRKYLIIILVIFIGGCGVWNDFTTYFNLYYNLTTIFEEAETRIKENQTELFIFKQKPLDKDVNTMLDKVIEKSSKILQFNSNSSYFDDALFITGKAFFYQGDFLKALRKFQELENRNSEDYRFVSRLWTGKTQLQLRNFDEGMNTLSEVRKLSAEAEQYQVAEDAVTAQVSFWIYRENYLTAIEYCKDLISLVNDDEKKSSVYYEMGLLYQSQNDPEEASGMFAKALEFEPSFEIEFYSQFEMGKIESELKHYDAAEEIFERLKEEDKYNVFFDQIDLERADIKYENGNYDEAMDEYVKIDSTYEKSSSAGEAAYKISLLYLDYYHNYDSARFYNEKAFGSLASDETVLAARSKRPIFAKYFDYREDLQKYGKQYLYITDSTAFLNDSLAFAAKIDSINKAKEIESEESDSTSTTTENNPRTNRPPVPPRKGTENQQTVDNSQAKQPVLIAPKRPRIPLDSLKTRISDTYYEIANLFYTEFNVHDSAKYYYEKTLYEYPGTTKNPAKALYALGNYYLTQDNTEKADSIFNYIYDNYPDREIVNEAAKKINKPLIVFQSDPLDEQYVAAESLYDNLQYKEAINEFLNIYKLNPSSRLAPKALYTVGYIYENDLDEPEKAFGYYDTLVTKYSRNDYSEDIKPKVDFYIEEQQRIADREKAIQDSIEASTKPVFLPDSGAVDSANVFTENPDSLQISESPSDAEGIPEGRERTVEGDLIEKIKQPADTTKKRVFPQK